MLAEVLDSLGGPEWLALGTALGLVFTAVAAGAFLLGERLFPAATQQSGSYPSGESRRRTEIRRYLDAIEEPFAEEHDIEAQAVDFYLPDRNVAITFDPRTYYRLERSDTYTVLAEHEMPGFQLGARLPFETPAIGDAPEPATAAYAVLGVPAGASTEEIRAAYRKRVKEVHPDHGGDREAFRRVREAYATATEQAS